MNLEQVIDEVDFRNLKFGLKPDQQNGLMQAEPIDLENFEVVEWLPFLPPVDSQTLSCCESCSGSAIMEIVARVRKKKSKLQLNYNIIYQYVIKNWYGGVDAGSRIGDCFRASQQLGILNYGCEAERGQRTIKWIIGGLKQGPVHVGVSIDDGWKLRNMNPDNNCIDHSFLTTTGNGHAIVIVAANYYNGVPMFQILNSWGGDQKLMYITPERLISTLLADPMIYHFPDSFDFEKIQERFRLA